MPKMQKYAPGFWAKTGENAAIFIEKAFMVFRK
jgi:hypothetical protein